MPVNPPLAFDLFAGALARGWEAALDDGELHTIGFELDPDACATARAAGLHTVQDDVARLVPATMALVYGQPEGLCCSPPCQTFSAAGKGAGRRLMEELHRAVTDAAGGASDIAMARHRRELRRLLRVHLRESGPKRRRADISADADQMARNVSLVWQPARWVARLRPRWVALEQVPAVLPLWQAMARALEQHGYRCWTGVLSSERFGVAQTRKRAILLASLDHQPQPPEATHQAYVPGEPAQEGEPDLFGPGLRPWRSMAEALGWGMSDEPAPTVMTARNRQTGHDVLRGSSWRAEQWRKAQDRPEWVTRADPDDIAVEVIHSEGTNGAWPRKGSEPSPTIRAGTKGSGPNLTVSLVANAQANAADPDAYWNRDDLAARKREAADGGDDVHPDWTANQPSPTVVTSRRSDKGGLVGRQLPKGRGRNVGGRDWVEGRPVTTVNGDPRISEPGHHDSNVSGSQQANAVRVSVHDAAALQKLPARLAVVGV
jgi:DNA (cytosine-5)-methyltransferase 1